MTIAIICPTRGRAHQFIRMHNSVVKTQSTGVNICSLIATDDPTDYEGLIDFDPALKIPPWPTVQSWNHGALMAAKEWPQVNLFMLGADDTIFATPGWDKALMDHYNALENKIHVYALQDSRDPNGTPHPIVTREYIDAMGYFMPPVFLHWFIDTWTIAIARANNAFTHLRGYELIHDKPSDRGQEDETHNHIRRMGWRERDKYVNDTCQHFLEHEKRRLHLKILELKIMAYKDNNRIGMYEEGCA